LNYFFLKHWHEFLPREAGHVVALMGSGGKTSLMRAMADVLAAENIPVVWTTTTRTEPLEGVPVMDRAELTTAKAMDLPLVFFLREETLPDGKWAGLKPEDVDALDTLMPDHLVLVEVDGAAKLPLKVHRDDEPIWPARTSLAVVVMGVGAVGSKVGEVVHRFGRQASPALEQHKDWTLLEWDHMAALILEDGGYLSKVPDEVPAVLAMMGLAEQDDSIGLFGFAGRAMEDPRLPLVILGELASEEPSLRTAVRDDDDSS